MFSIALISVGQNVGQGRHSSHEIHKMTNVFGRKNVRKFRLMPSKEGSEHRALIEITPGVKSASEDEMIDVETVDDQPTFGSVAAPLENQQVGESAKYGIYYDDRVYDYTKHLKPIGVTLGAVYVDAKVKTNVETEEEIMNKLNKATYVNISQLDLDPSVRETLEALDDEAYVVDEGMDDYFQHLDEDTLTDDDDSIDASNDFEGADCYDGFEDKDTQDTHLHQREEFSDAKLEDVMQDLLSFEQPERESAKKEKPKKKKATVSKEERIAAAARELELARQTMNLKPEDLIKSALKTEQATKHTFVAVSDPEEGEDYSLVSPLAAPIIHTKVIREPSKPHLKTKKNLEEPRVEPPKVAINRGAARSKTETAEQRRARKALAKSSSDSVKVPQ